MIQEIINFITNITNRILSIIGILANDFNLTDWVLTKLPILGTVFTYNQLVILTTIISGLLLTYIVYRTLIAIAKRTLNFGFFVQWVIILTIIGGIVFDVAKMVI